MTDAAQANAFLRPYQTQVSVLLPGDSSQAQKHLQPKKPDLRVKVFKEIKAQLRMKRDACVKQLLFEQTKARIRDCWLKRMSPNFSHVWKLFQAKAFILSMVRNVVKTYRVFGIAGKVVDEKRNTTGPSKQPKRRLPLRMYPEDGVLYCHGVVLLLIFCYSVLFFPLQMAFGAPFAQRDHSFSSSNCLVLSYLTADLCMRFFTVVRQDGELIEGLSELARRYVCSYFLLDVLGSLPFEYFTDIRDRAALNALFAVRLCRIFSTVFSKKCWGNFFRSRLKSMITSSKMMKVLETLSLTLTAIHLSTCILLFLTRFVSPVNWLTKYILITRFESPDRHISYSKSAMRAYLLGFYYTTVTMTTLGFGDITPTNLCTFS